MPSNDNGDDLLDVRGSLRAKTHDSESGCWLWDGYITPKGYGTVRFNGKNVRAHRLSYELHIGAIPKGLQLDHLCRVRHCINPAHLEPVTLQENLRRGLGGINNAIKTHCPHGHPYDRANTRTRRRGRGTGRLCRACSRLRNQRLRTAEGAANGQQ